MSLCLGLIIITAAEPWYPLLKNVVASSRTKNHQLDIGRTILQLMKQDIQFSGYQGCRTMDSHYPVRRNFVTFAKSNRFFQWNRNLFGVNSTFGSCYAYLPRSMCDRAIENSDILVIYNIPYSFRTLTHDMHNPKEVLEIHGKGIIRKGGMFLISDCF